jgi:lysyl-tRNA synthetase class 2
MLRETLKRGDIIGVEGTPGRTKAGEMSVRASKIQALSYCLHMLPTDHEIKKNPLTKDTRYRHRYMDLIMNSNIKRIFKIRN